MIQIEIHLDDLNNEYLEQINTDILTKRTSSFSHIGLAKYLLTQISGDLSLTVDLKMLNKVIFDIQFACFAPSLAHPNRLRKKITFSDEDRFQLNSSSHNISQ